MTGNRSSHGADLFFDCHVFCCINERPQGHERGSCKAAGSEKLQNYMKSKLKLLMRDRGLEGQRIRINKSLCLDRCELGPVMVIYPEGVWYSYRSTEDIDEILERHIMGGEKVERLMITPEQ